MREAGERSSIPQAYVLHDTTAKQHTLTEVQGEGAPTLAAHPVSLNHDCSHTDLKKTLAQRRT